MVPPFRYYRQTFAKRVAETPGIFTDPQSFLLWCIPERSHADRHSAPSASQCVGSEESNRVKTEVTAAVNSDIAPAAFETTSRFSRAAVRVALRQLARFKGETARVARWRAVHDSAKYEPDDHHPDH